MEITAQTIRNAMLGDAQDNRKIENCKPQLIPAVETDAEYQARVLAGRAFFAAFDAAPLEGSEKQVAWARDIRRNKIISIIRNITSMSSRAHSAGKGDVIEAGIADISAKFNEMLNQSSAKWWIDNR